MPEGQRDPYKDYATPLLERDAFIVTQQTALEEDAATDTPREADGE